VPESPVSESVCCGVLVLKSPVSESPVSELPVSESPVSESPVSESPVSESQVLGARGYCRSRDSNKDTTSEAQ